jgi:hypothetical protein
MIVFEQLFLGSVKILNRLFHLNLGPYAISGVPNTIRAFIYNTNKPFESTYGESQRHIYFTASWDSSLSVMQAGIDSPFIYNHLPLHSLTVV